MMATIETPEKTCVDAQEGIDEDTAIKVFDAYKLRMLLMAYRESAYQDGFVTGMFITALLSAVIFLIYLFIMYHLGAF